MRIDFDTDTPQLHATIARNAARSIHKQAAELADTTPPVEPPAPVALAQPRAHRVVAWRHDGGLRTTDHATLEAAREDADALSFVIYWKFAIMCGREMIARALIEEPQS